MRPLFPAILATIALVSTRPEVSFAECVEPPASVISWWTADGNPMDLLENNHGSLIGGMGFGSGKVAQAFYFDGINDFIDCGNATTARPDFPFTVDFWVNMSSPSTLYALASTDVVGNGLYSGFRVYVSSLGAVITGIGSDLGCCTSQYRRNKITANGLITVGNWHYVAAVFESATSHLIYVDGALQATTDSGLATEMNYGSGNRMDIGRIFDPSTGQTTYGNGHLDEIGLYGEAVSGGKILEIYQAGTDGMCKDSPIPTESGSWGVLKSRFGG